MQQRIEAMIAGVATVQPPLDKFYGLVNDEQKARLNAVAEDQESKTRRRGNRSLARACDMTEPSALKWPADEIEARLRPTDAQRADLAALQEASAKAADMLSAIVPGRRRTHAAGAARRCRQAARHHAAGGQAGAYGARSVLCDVERRAESPIRGDRPAADLLSRQVRYDAAAQPQIIRRDRHSACDPCLLSGITKCRTKGPLMTANPVLWNLDGRGVATVTLNRPEVNNAYDAGLINGVLAAMDELGRKPNLRVVVLKGNGKHFQAGADLKWINGVRPKSATENEAVSRATSEAVQRLNTLPIPTVALVQGGCFGGGTGVISACDVVIAADNALFSITEVRWGLTAAIIIPQLCDAIGVRQVRRYALTGERFGAADARRIGLVHEVVPLAELEAAGAKVRGAVARQRSRKPWPRPRRLRWKARSAE